MNVARTITSLLEDCENLYYWCCAFYKVAQCTLHCQTTKLVFHRSSALFKSSQTCPSANCCFTFLGLNLKSGKTIFCKDYSNQHINFCSYLIRDLRLAQPFRKNLSCNFCPPQPPSPFLSFVHLFLGC